jgi:hypothetical protein
MDGSASWLGIAIKPLFAPALRELQPQFYGIMIAGLVSEIGVYMHCFELRGHMTQVLADKYMIQILRVAFEIVCILLFNRQILQGICEQIALEDVQGLRELEIIEVAEDNYVCSGVRI